MGCHPVLSWWPSPQPLICRSLSCQLSCLSICPLIPAKTSGDGMPADSTTPKSKRTQLTNRPKLSLAPGTDSQRPKPRAKSAGKTGTGPRHDNPKKPRGVPQGGEGAGKARPATAARPKSKHPAHKSGKPGQKRVVAARQVCFDILVAVAEGAQLDAAMNANADLGDLDDRDRRFVQLLAATCLRRSACVAVSFGVTANSGLRASRTLRSNEARRGVVSDGSGPRLGCGARAGARAAF